MERQHTNVALSDRIGTITLDRPEARNALNAPLMEELISAFDELEAGGAYVVILRAVPGARVWSAGHDINELPGQRRDPLGYQDPLERLIRRVQDFPMPVIAMVEGSVWGGACDLCVSCDIIVAAEGSTFAITPAKLGVPYNASGLVRFLNVLGPHRAKEMFFTGQPLTAQEANTLRMVSHVVPAEGIEQYTFNLASTIRHNAPLAVGVLKKQFRLLLKGQMLSSETFERIQGMRREVYDSEDYEEGIRAFKEKRRPQFKGR